MLGLIRQSKRLVCICLCLLLAASLVPKASHAQTAPTASGLSLSPTISQFTLSPGQITTFNITLKNITNSDITAEAQVADFVADGTTGAPKIIGPPNPTTPTSIKKFVGTLYNVPLKVGEQKTVTVTLDPPPGTSPGAYYGVIKYRAIPAGVNAPNADQIALTASVATVVLITVPGNLHEQVQLSAIHVYRGTRDSSFFVNKPQQIGVEIKNLGNGFEKPFGTVTVQNMFGKKVDDFQFNNPKQLGNVLPASTRIFTHPLSGISQIGRYTVTANAAYGSGGNVLTMSKSFWYVPLWLLIAIIVVLVLLVLTTLRFYLRYRRESKHSYKKH